MFDKNVYVGSMSFEYVNIYSIGMNIPTLYDFPAYQTSLLELYADEDNQDLIVKHKRLSGYGGVISNLNSQFNKYEILPDSLWVTSNKNPLPKNEEYIFQVLIGGIILREPCAKILQQFNLGQTTLTPLKIYEYETRELWSDEIFYFLNLCEHRQYINYPQSDETFVYIQGAKRYSTRGIPIQPNTLEVNKSILDCDIDLWHDPMLGSSIFMSDKLYQTLNDENMIYQWNMKSCQLI
ncbi:hypothetical protein [Moraxella oblonga]|uniref:hypothetical protein n=1 Tax=Moraxella oblonga TaxID=200413 RepID=UPI0008368862|nr:hypothetical protein [Moraxella oblonga]